MKPASKTAVLALIVLLTAVLYLPGLGSRFLLDDFYNLQNLDLVRDYGYSAYIFSSGIAGPLGRPLSLLTFALQHDNWPHDPAAFKLINICLHLVNGILVFIVCNLLAGRVTRDRNFQFLWPIIVTVLWLLHPIQISTTLYAVQRMTQLSTLFTLMGIAGYLYFRLKFSESSRWPELLRLSLAYICCLLCAVLSKENGILLPLYILIIEWTLLADFRQYLTLKLWKGVFLGAPLLALAAYLVINAGNMHGSFQSRDYTMLQKLISEGPVLTEYMKNIILPKSSAFGLYHDDFQVSTGLLAPPATLVSGIIIFGLISLAVKLRKTVPVFGFSILWFFGGHILESTYLDLELYFEHRNYMPSIGLFSLMGWLVVSAAALLSRKWIVYTAAVAYCLLAVAVSRNEIDIWSKPGVQALVWANRHPQSERALYDLMQHYSAVDDYDNADRTLARLEGVAPAKIYPHLLKVVLYECQTGRVMADAAWDNIIIRSKLAEPDKLVTISLLDRLVLDVIQGSCPDLDAGKLELLIYRLLDHPGFSASGAYLFEYLSSLSLYRGDRQNALNLIRQSLRLDFTVPRKIQELNLLRLLGEMEQVQTGNEELQAYIKKDYRLRLGYGRMLEKITF